MRFLWALSLILGSAHFARSYTVSRIPFAHLSSSALSCGTNSGLHSEKTEEYEVEKYVLRVKILEEALLVMRDRFENQEKQLAANKAENVTKIEYMLSESEREKQDLEKSLSEAQEDFDRFQKRTDILEKALSKSREKAQDLDVKIKEAVMARGGAEAELKEVNLDNERLVSRIDENERELISARNAQKGRQRDRAEISRLKAELENTRMILQNLESEYSSKISDLEAFIEDAKRNELVEREQLGLLVQSAQAEAADLRLTVEKNEKLIAELKTQGGSNPPSSAGTASTDAMEGKLAQTTQLLETTIALLGQFTEVSRGRVQDTTQERAGSHAADYLIAGDLRDQRRILESQAELLERVLVQIEAMSYYRGEVAYDSRQLWPSSAPAGDRRGGARGSGRESSRSRQLPEGYGVNVPGVATIKRTGRRALHGVKRGLGFLVGLEVPPLKSEVGVIHTHLEAGRNGDEA